MCISLGSLAANYYNKNLPEACKLRERRELSEWFESTNMPARLTGPTSEAPEADLTNSTKGISSSSLK